jgi:acyl carrier protein
MMGMNYFGGIIMTTFEKLKPLIADQLGVKMEIIKPESSFKDDLEADSLDMVDLTMEIEDEFAIEINDKIAATLQTVGDVVNYIESNRK